MSLRDEMLKNLATSSIEEAMETLGEEKAEAVEESDDEIVAAIHRQLDVLEGTAVLMANALQMISLQLVNLRKEVALLDTPVKEAPKAMQVAGTPQPITVANPQPTLPGMEQCLHPDAIVVQTNEGPVRVCPDCDE